MDDKQKVNYSNNYQLLLKCLDVVANKIFEILHYQFIKVKKGMQNAEHDQF